MYPIILMGPCVIEQDIVRMCNSAPNGYSHYCSKVEWSLDKLYYGLSRPVCVYMYSISRDFACYACMVRDIRTNVRIYFNWLHRCTCTCVCLSGGREYMHLCNYSRILSQLRVISSNWMLAKVYMYVVYQWLGLQVHAHVHDCTCNVHVHNVIWYMQVSVDTYTRTHTHTHTCKYHVWFIDQSLSAFEVCLVHVWMHVHVCTVCVNSWFVHF